MRGLRRALGAALLTAGLLAGGSAGAATRTVKLTSVIATGSLTYTWSGDAVRGCAAAGVCGIHGELILQPQTTGQSVAPSGPINLNLDGSGTIRVIREEGGAVLGGCTDALGSDAFGGLFFNASRYRAMMATVEPPPSSGRCAGPTTADLAGVSVPVRRTGRFSFDLTGTRQFTAGPFRGRLVSTVRLIPAPGSLGGGGFSSSSSGGHPGHPVPSATPPTVEFVQLQYRVSAAPNAIQTQFSGAGQPTCRIFDACGASGSLAFTIAPARGLTLIGSRMVHRRLSRRQVLNDLRRGRFDLSAFQLLSGHVSEVLTWPGRPSCRDAVVTPTLLLGTGVPSAPRRAGRTIPVTISSNGGGPATEVFRTHCPGPEDEDLFGAPPNAGNETYARGSVTTAELLARRSVLTLSEPGAFNGLGYSGSRTGAIVLDLTLTKVIARTQR